MGTTLQSCRFISPAPAPFATVRALPPSTLAFVPQGCRERRRWPSRNQQRHGQPPAVRPCLVVRANNLPVWPLQPYESADRRYLVEERNHVMDHYVDIVRIDDGCLYMEAIKMSGELCLLADDALKMAAQIMALLSRPTVGIHLPRRRTTEDN